MKRILGVVLAAGLAAGLGGPARADGDKDAGPILDKAIKAMGGETKLEAAERSTWKNKGTITLMGNDNEFKSKTTVDGLRHFRSEFEGDFGGNTVQGVTVVAGDKGWRKFGDNLTELDKDGLANERRRIYLDVVPMTIVPLKGKGFKVEAIGEDKVGGKPALIVKVTPPQGKEFKLYFDKESGLPVKLVARVRGFMGEDFTQTTLYSRYKEFQGVKKATKIETQRDGEKFMDVEVKEFKLLDKVDADTFTEPK